MEYKGFKETKALAEAMTNYLFENGLHMDFTYTCYPMKLRITPDDDQMTIFSTEREKLPSVTFSIGINEIGFAFDGEMDIDEGVFNKIRTSAKKLHYTFLQEYFAALIAGGQRVKTIEEYDEYFYIIPKE